MLEKIELLSKGEALKEEKNFSFNVDFVKDTLNFGKIYKGSFCIKAIDDKEKEIHISSTNHRVKILEDTIISKDCEVFYTVDTNGLKANDVIEGKIVVYSIGLENTIPFQFSIDYFGDSLIIHSINTKEDFYNLFLKSPETVLRIFKDKEFKEAPFLQNNHLQMIYDSIIKCDNILFSLNQFLSDLGYDVSNIIQVPPVKDDIQNKSEYLIEFENERKLKDLYIDQLEDNELVEQVSILLIRAGIKNDVSFKFYEKAILNHSNITRLYENYLYSIPKNYKKTFPKEVYLYFSTNKSISYDTAYPLFINIAKNLAKQSDIFQMFEDQMREMALDFLYKNKIDDDIACLYDKILIPDMINESTANILIYILRYFKIEVLGSDIKNIIVKYKEINGENIFPVYNGICYATIFFDGFELLFEDKEGKRYSSRNNRIRPMLDRPELEELCYKIAPELDILKLARLRTILNNNINNENELIYAIRVANELDLSKLTLKSLINIVLNYAYNNFDNIVNCKEEVKNFIDNLNKENLSNECIELVLKLYLKMNDVDSAFNIIGKYNLYKFSIDVLTKACVMAINSNNIDLNKEVIEEVCIHLIRNKIKEKDILLYLVENYNKDTSTMCYIINLCEEMFIPSFPLAKRLLEKYLITDDIANIDYVFDIYIKYKTDDEDDTLIKAFVTKKCIGYFLYERELSENTLLPLENIIFNNLDNVHHIPKIYVFSMTKYLSTKDSINTSERKALNILSEYMMNDRIVFAFTKELYKFIDMKEELANAEYIEYHAQNNEIPKAFITINDGKEIECELFNVYKNIYVRPILIYKNERINYKIFNVNKIEDGVLKEGTFVYNKLRNNAYVSPNKIKSPVKYINEAIDLFEQNDYIKLKELIKEMTNREGLTKELFNI